MTEENNNKCFYIGIDLFFRLLYMYGSFLGSPVPTPDKKTCWLNLWFFKVLTIFFHSITFLLRVLSLVLFLKKKQGSCGYKEFRKWLFVLDIFFVPILAIFGMITLEFSIPKECLGTEERIRELVFWQNSIMIFIVILVCLCMQVVIVQFACKNKNR